MMRVALHVHSFASYDCLTNEKAILRECENNNINVIAITDHNEVFGAVHLQKVLPIKVIVGEEISTLDGEIIGLFLTDKIPSGLSLAQTVDHIKSQNGLVYLPHPFDISTGKRHAVSKTKAETIIKDIDIIETFNSRTFAKVSDLDAYKFANEHKILSAVGSDAHTPNEIKNAIIEMNYFDSAQEFLSSLNSAGFIIKKAKIQSYLITKWVRLNKKYLNL